MAYLLTGWDIARTGSISCVVSDDDDGPTLVTVTAGTYAHRDLSSIMGSGNYDDFATLVQTTLNTVLTTNPCTVTWSASTLKYTIDSASGDILLDFDADAASRRFAAMLGFNYSAADGGSTADPYGVVVDTSTPAVSSVVPRYALELAKDGASDYSRPFEVAGQTVRSTSVNANAYSLGPTTYEKRASWRHRFETLARVFASDADDTVAPWTYEDLIAHARAWEPVLLSAPLGDLVFKFVEAEFSEESRRPEFSNYHGTWDLSVRAQTLGLIV